MRTTLDTNVLVRLVVSDNLEQQAAAKSLIQQGVANGDDFLITTVCLAEFCWVLKKARGYSYDRKSIANALKTVLEVDCFVIDDARAVQAAVDAYRDGSADFADYLIYYLGESRGSDQLVTFDKKFARYGRCSLLKSGTSKD